MMKKLKATTCWKIFKTAVYFVENVIGKNWHLKFVIIFKNNNFGMVIPEKNLRNEKNRKIERRN